MNHNWNQSDPHLYPETQWNILLTGSNCKSDLFLFCSSVSVLQNSPKTCYSYRSDTDRCVLIWYCPDATAVLIQFRKYACNRTFWQQNCIGSQHFLPCMHLQSHSQALLSLGMRPATLQHMPPTWKRMENYHLQRLHQQMKHTFNFSEGIPAQEMLLEVN